MGGVTQDAEEGGGDVPATAGEETSKSKVELVIDMFFTAAMINFSLTPMHPFSHWTAFTNNPKLANVFMLAYAALISIWWFSVWKERACRIRKQAQFPRCSRMRCFLCRAKREQPRQFKFWSWLTFFFLYALLACFIWSIQSFPIRDQTPNWKGISQFIALDIGVILINFIVAYSFRVYYLHDEGTSLTEIGIV
ncbi:hypothetical protein N7582_001453 [Saccharomyces uvarum]|uniref:Transmembrane protein n=1 Tax=Saccharomyces uvarum TaxID=230603 RepID=A0AA35JHE3_SACUV|nr:hypothetical protein N7582_001453 [Saccharomyces uvarum]CAI4059774.1 hypothetical protein SUVC_05G0630 [Saccharomyces uvarum]